jgi:hypothetical protein
MGVWYIVNNLSLESQFMCFRVRWLLLFDLHIVDYYYQGCVTRFRISAMHAVWQSGFGVLTPRSASTTDKV